MPLWQAQLDPSALPPALALQFALTNAPCSSPWPLLLPPAPCSLPLACSFPCPCPCRLSPLQLSLPPLPRQVPHYRAVLAPLGLAAGQPGDEGARRTAVAAAGPERAARLRHAVLRLAKVLRQEAKVPGQEGEVEGRVEPSARLSFCCAPLYL